MTDRKTEQTGDDDDHQKHGADHWYVSEVYFQGIPADKCQELPDISCFRKRISADPFRIQKSADAYPEQHNAGPGEDGKIITRNKIRRQDPEDHQPGRSFDLFKNESQQNEKYPGDQIPFAEPQKWDTYDHRKTHHLQEVEVHVPCVIDEQNDQERSDHGDTDADQKYLDPAFQDGEMIGTAGLTSHPSVTQNKGSSGYENKNACPNRQIEIETQPHLHVKDVKDAQKKDGVEKDHRQKR
ncbi:hypothetical protein SDC9_17342 [bioreactor metagenome]|uniref:Uncharacterized protein n=1 Tax=bioreactor metagenome TaxID=1076179 RepID=A0A644TX94_9ZZZZ